MSGILCIAVEHSDLSDVLAVHKKGLLVDLWKTCAIVLKKLLDHNYLYSKFKKCSTLMM